MLALNPTGAAETSVGTSSAGSKPRMMAWEINRKVSLLMLLYTLAVLTLSFSFVSKKKRLT